MLLPKWQTSQAADIASEIFLLCTRIDVSIVFSTMDENPRILQVFVNSLQLNFPSSSANFCRGFIAILRMGGALVRPMLLRAMDVNMLMSVLSSKFNVRNIDLQCAVFQVILEIFQNLSEIVETKAILQQTIAKLHAMDIEKYMCSYMIDVLKDELGNDSITTANFYEPCNITEYAFLRKSIITLTSDHIHKLLHSILLVNMLSTDLSTHNNILNQNNFTINETLVVSESLFSVNDRILQSLALNSLMSHREIFSGSEDFGGDVENRVILSLLRMISNICSHTSSGRGVMMRAYAFVDSTIRIAAKSSSLSILNEATRLLHLFAYHPHFAGALLMSRQHQNLCFAG